MFLEVFAQSCGLLQRNSLNISGKQKIFILPRIKGTRYHNFCLFMNWLLLQLSTGTFFQVDFKLLEIFAILHQDKTVVLYTQAGKMLEQAALICRDMDRYV
jgi:hypothetical protein